MTLWIDQRWDGQHGIGRYAREVTARLTLESNPLPVAGPTASAFSAFQNVPPGIIYSPGYGPFVKAERQLLTVHDLIHLRVPWPRRAKYLAFYNLVTRPLIRRTGYVMTVSDTSKREIEDWVNDPNVEVVNAGLGASEAFHPNVRPAVSEVPYVLYVGNSRAHKNLRSALSAMRSIRDAELRLLIPPAEHGEIADLCDALGISRRVRFLMPLDDDGLARQYRGAAATIMPSISEGFGLPPLESLMTGTPVIFWAGCDAVAETVGERGWAVEDAYDPLEWAARIEIALRLRRRVSPPSRDYDWNSTVKRVSETLHRLL